jgi:hypothetical protein
MTDAVVRHLGTRRECILSTKSKGGMTSLTRTRSILDSSALSFLLEFLAGQINCLYGPHVCDVLQGIFLQHEQVGDFALG